MKRIITLDQKDIQDLLAGKEVVVEITSNQIHKGDKMYIFTEEGYANYKDYNSYYGKL